MIYVQNILPPPPMIYVQKIEPFLIFSYFFVNYWEFPFVISKLLAKYWTNYNY